MIRRLLLSLFSFSTILVVNAQNTQKINAYAITGVQKGSTNWSEVRLVDLSTGSELKNVYNRLQAPELLNARTGKRIVQKQVTTPVTFKEAPKMEMDQNPRGPKAITFDNGNKVMYVQHNLKTEQTDLPFATKSAALAYDKKHERLYYTPMGISQLRYIDLKSKTQKIYYFEDEAFGAVRGSYDMPNQITRMVIASDGNGYALSNDANHLVRFTTNKKAVITDLGPLSDDAANAISIHRQTLFGGDMVADDEGNLYLVSANNKVYKINIEAKLATYLGVIKGLPAGYTTNGAAVENGTKMIVCSSNSTEGYFRVDLNGLRAERMEASNVFNASDLANGNLLSFKKKEEKTEEQVVETKSSPATILNPETRGKSNLAIYPNPVTDGLVKVSFTNQPAGQYQLQLVDGNGKVLKTQSIVVSGKMQVAEFRLPIAIAKGSYLLRVASENNEMSYVNKLLVQ